MSTLTDKERALVKTIVRLNDKESIEYELQDCMDDHVSSDKVFTSLKLLGLRLPDDILTVQYLRYASENYENIKNNDFSQPITRMQMTDFEYTANETQTVYIRYSIKSYAFEDEINKTANAIESDFWDWDPDEVDRDYGDSDTNYIEHDSSDPYGDEYVLK